MLRAETAHGQPIEFVRMTSHAHITYADFGLHTPELAALGEAENERIFRRDCLEIDVTIAGRPLTIYSLHFKSMGSPRNGLDGREATMPIRIAEAQAVRRIIEDRFGKDHAGDKLWVICGDLNDYRERVLIKGEAHRGYQFEPVDEAQSSLNVLLAGGFCENIVERRPELDRWTLYHTRGPAGAASLPARLHPAVAGDGAAQRQGYPRHHPRRPAVAHAVPAGPGGGTLSAYRLGPAQGVRPLPGRRDAGHCVRETALSFALPLRRHPAGRRNRRGARSVAASVRAGQGGGDRGKLAS